MVDVRTPRLRLDPNTGNSLLLVGSSKSGKSTVLMALFKKYYNNKDYISTLFAANAQIPLYDGFDKYLLKTSGFKANHAAYIRSHQFVNKKTNNRFKWVEMFDDMVDLRHSTLIKNLILSYRNSNISSMICMQGIKLLTPDCRSNLNNIIFLWFNNEEAIQSVLDVFLKSYFLKLDWPKNMHVEKYRELTKDHNYLYLHILSESLWSSRYGQLIEDGAVV